ncbi:MAG: FAD-dependent oxidoreductase [Comamonadaceae bacterium]|jgi:NADPH-dependent 2,4-dienoyl-CoA reductase/sulfur reductase-like enzyme/rhodanese-related sulfurtransferase|nr:FAD-dependent oxidoreductase [Comamonadaceae bacterium]MBK9200457.1 FAD-dependent oxidoreductase [Betaproteobacteria bacterium]MBK6556767.1 FAD-dependent oxidoreductase [Comamonadaceae bacterium]MBK6926295.1 FAD-dependent oxidoreductase [Comamonadaceae bacterium]MBK7118555.1 FAD-dependent oxidoreductase [Comamonadaceae bacterium]
MERKLIMKVIIVGGVAGGASCAARLRRLDEKAEILMVERGPYVSYANCGLPYHISGVIEKEASLMVANAPLFKVQFAIEARTNCEATAVSPKNKTVDLRDVTTGAVTTESYDKLVLSPGALSIRPPLPGIDLPGIFQVRTVPDARTIRQWIEKGTDFLEGMYKYGGIQFVKPARRAVVIGGGFIGLETAENLVHLGFEVTLVEMLDQVLAPLDREFARLVEEHLKKHGVRMALGDGVAGFSQLEGGALEVKTQSGRIYPADLVILALGVRPDTALAKAAGLEIGERGGICVDDQMRTSDPDIFAVGDAIEVKDFVTGQWSLIALAGPANRQGRIAADVIAGRESRFRGTQGTSIIGLFSGAAAWTGASEKTLKRIGDTDFEKIYLFPNSHAGYYPGAKMLALKVLFRKSDGRLLGAQALGEDGPAVDKRISALAVALQMGATIYDLEEAELCYAPQFGSAKDAVNFAGMVAADVLRGDMPLAHWADVQDGFLLDVRQPVELVVESVPGAVNIPLGQLRTRLAELPRDREILVICRSAQRAYYATRILLQNGFKARNISGGMLSRALSLA